MIYHVKKKVNKSDFVRNEAFQWEGTINEMRPVLRTW